MGDERRAGAGLAGDPDGDTFAGGLLIERTGNIAAVYAGIGLASALIAFAFTFTALGHAEKYLPEESEG